MEQTEIDSALAAAKSFFTDMAEWETWCSGMDLGTQTFDEQRQKLDEIFHKHLSANALSRKQDRLHSLEFGTPPEFAEPIIKAEDAGDGMVWVYKSFGWGQTQRYLVKKENEVWKIDTKEDEGSSAGKWLKRPNL